MTVSALKGSVVPLLTNATTVAGGTGEGVAVSNPIHYPRFHIRGTGTIGAGAFVIEEALDPAYAGTWSTIATFAAVDFTGGKEQVLHILGNLGAVRARVTTDITGGGNISVDLVGS